MAFQSALDIDLAATPSSSSHGVSFYSDTEEHISFNRKPRELGAGRSVS